jgi:DNA-binding transcriptional regulator YhcF (GntR family)
MDHAILHAIWFDCPNLPDTAHKLLLALTYHGSPCCPSVERLAVMIRRSERQTQYLLRHLEQEGYITVKKGEGRSKSSTYTMKVQPGLHPNSYLEQDIKNARARGEDDGKKDDDGFSKGERFLTPGSLAHQHAHGIPSPA